MNFGLPCDPLSLLWIIGGGAKLLAQGQCRGLHRTTILLVRLSEIVYTQSLEGLPARGNNC